MCAARKKRGKKRNRSVFAGEGKITLRPKWTNNSGSGAKFMSLCTLLQREKETETRGKKSLEDSSTWKSLVASIKMCMSDLLFYTFLVYVCLWRGTVVPYESSRILRGSLKPVTKTRQVTSSYFALDTWDVSFCFFSLAFTSLSLLPIDLSGRLFLFSPEITSDQWPLLSRVVVSQAVKKARRREKKSRDNRSLRHQILNPHLISFLFSFSQNFTKKPFLASPGGSWSLHSWSIDSFESLVFSALYLCHVLSISRWITFSRSLTS